MYIDANIAKTALMLIMMGAMLILPTIARYYVTHAPKSLLVTSVVNTNKQVTASILTCIIVSLIVINR